MKSLPLRGCFSILFLIFMHWQVTHISAGDFDQSNITILQEVENDPLELNTHEVLPAKPVKKKPYAILEKPSEYVKIPVVKSYNAHTVAFDFNLGDLEDIHDSIVPAGDLSSEERHLLRNTNDEDLTYSEESILTPSPVSTYVTPMATDTLVNTTKLTTSRSTSMSTEDNEITSPSTMSSLSIYSFSEATTPVILLPTEINSIPAVSVGSVSPHIYKILSKSKSKGKSIHDLPQKDEQTKAYGNHFNSISTLFGDTAENSTADALQPNVNLFHLMVNLYDHFFWQPSEIRTKVSPACGVEILSYLSALNSNYEWAQKAYDSSGHYKGQIFFGSNKWLGQRQFCLEVNRNEFHDERKHFEFDFYVATIHIAALMPTNLTTDIQLGECLPKSCTTRDVGTILQLDPHAKTLTTSMPYNSSTYINIKGVRTVPGPYCVWKDVKFVLFVIFCIILILVVITATWYESDLNKKIRPGQIDNGPKVDPKIGMNPELNGKTLEAYQMTQIKSTIDNNNLDIEADSKNITKQHTKQSTKPQEHTDPVGVIAKQQCSDVNANHVELSSEMQQKKLGLYQEILLCFAFQRNASTILSVEVKMENQTSCVHGLRVLSVLWTILVHTYLQMFTIGENRFLRVITERTFLYQFVGNATFSVDTFFFISGFLVTLLFLKQGTDRKGKGTEEDGFVQKSLKKSFWIIIYRYIRLTPVYIFVILFNELSLRYISDRSVFQPTVATKTCSEYWWRNILYINNFFPLSQICMIWSWYMANDMQFYVMATLLLIFSTRYFKTTILILSAFLVSSWGISGMVSIHYNYTHKVADPFESFNFLYDKPWQRVGTYIVGMVAGYVMYMNKIPPKISCRLNILLWITSLGLLFVIIFGVWSGQLDVITTAFYVSVGHTAFGVGLVWIVLSCCWGLANPVNKVLSYPGLLPLSRLTYCTYLIHPVIMLLTSSQMEGTVHLNNQMIWIIFLGNAVVSFMTAFLISVVFEAPVVRLLKILLKK